MISIKASTIAGEMACKPIEFDENCTIDFVHRQLASAVHCHKLDLHLALSHGGFIDATSDEDGTVSELLRALPQSCEQRLGPDRKLYTWQQFRAYFGSFLGSRIWEKAPSKAAK